MTRADLIAAVLADPDALWAVRTASVRLAGSWDRKAKSSCRVSDQDSCSYGDHNPEVVAAIEERAISRTGYVCHACAKGGKGPFCQRCGAEMDYEPGAKAWRVTTLPDDIERNLRGSECAPPKWWFSADTREEAEAWCDARLREAGVLLAGCS